MAAHPPSPWQRFRRKVRNEGPLHTALLILNSLVPRPLLDVGVWVVVSTDLSTFVDAEVPAVGARWASEPSDDAFIVQGWKHADLGDGLARGEPTAVIERDGKVVAWVFFATERFRQKDWMWFVVGDREIYSSWSFVEPEYRGQGLLSQLTVFAYREFVRQGYLRDYGVIDALNRSSLRAFSKVRHWPIGRIAYVRCCGLTVIRIGRRVRAGFWSADNPLVIDFSTFGDSQVKSKKVKKGTVYI